MRDCRAGLFCVASETLHDNKARVFLGRYDFSGLPPTGAHGRKTVNIFWVAVRGLSATVRNGAGFGRVVAGSLNV